MKTEKQNLGNFGLLIRDFFKPVYIFACGYVHNPDDAEDITQEIFLKMWRCFNKFDRKRNPRVWIFTIAKNATIDFLRKKKSKKRLLDGLSFSELGNDVKEVFLAPILLPSELLEQQEIFQKLKTAMTKLSTACREVLQLRYEKGLKFEQIARLLGKSLSTVKTQHRLAIIALKENLKRGDK